VITKEGKQYLRPYDVANEKGVRQGKYSYQRGATGKFNANAKVSLLIKMVMMTTTSTGSDDIYM